MACIFNWFQGDSFHKGGDNYEILKKKNEDAYIEKYNTWKNKYSPEFVKNMDLANQMMKELLVIPRGFFDGKLGVEVGKKLQVVCSNRQAFKKYIISVLKKRNEEPIVRLWIQYVYAA